MTRNFVVAALDPKVPSRNRHFSDINAAARFAASQAKQAWGTPEWTVKVVDSNGADTGIRVIVDVSHNVQVRNWGVLVGDAYGSWGDHLYNGSISSKGKLLTNCPSWDLLDPYLTSKDN